MSGGSVEGGAGGGRAGAGRSGRDGGSVESGASGGRAAIGAEGRRSGGAGADGSRNGEAGVGGSRSGSGGADGATGRRSERAAELVNRWVRCYTRQLPAPIAERRAGEINADLYDHIAHERARGTSDRRIATSVLSRLVRGLPADAIWRGGIRPWRGDLVKSFVAVLAAALAVIVVGVVAILYGGGDDSPGLVLIGVLLIVGAFAIGVRSAHRRGQGAGRRPDPDRP